MSPSSCKRCIDFSGDGAYILAFAESILLWMLSVVCVAVFVLGTMKTRGNKTDSSTVISHVDCRNEEQADSGTCRWHYGHVVCAIHVVPACCWRRDCCRFYRPSFASRGCFCCDNCRCAVDFELLRRHLRVIGYMYCSAPYLCFKLYF